MLGNFRQTTAPHEGSTSNVFNGTAVFEQWGSMSKGSGNKAGFSQQKSDFAQGLKKAQTSDMHHHVQYGRENHSFRNDLQELCRPVWVAQQIWQ